MWPLPSCVSVGEGTPPSLLSFCPRIKQLPLSLFSHGSRRSVHASSALAKAFQCVCSLRGTSQDTSLVSGCWCVCLVTATVCVLPVLLCVCVCVCEHLHSNQKPHGQFVTRCSNNGFCGEAVEDTKILFPLFPQWEMSFWVREEAAGFFRSLSVTDKKRKMIHVCTVWECVRGAEVHNDSWHPL